jgi:hypothetical protein
MTTRRRRFWLVLIAVLVLAGGVCTWIWITSPGLRCHDAQQIVDGMTRNKVISIFGKPPDFDAQATKGTSSIWNTKDGMIKVDFDDDGHVTGKDINCMGEFQWMLHQLFDRLMQ